MSVVILAIESSCDDTSAAVIRDGQVLSNCVANQEAHRLYGGVVPELASRAHQAHIIPVVDRALREAGITPAAISAVAFTRGPGLLGSLLVGMSFAKGLALSLGAPLIEVDHMQAHVLAHFIEDGNMFNIQQIYKRPFGFALGLQIVILLIPSFLANLSRYNPMRISCSEGANHSGWPFL
jgi:glycoprotease/Kae1 family metallohydrolase